ncbi:MAG: hypothetical protein K8S54_00415 [Spirochaetia bacterium]|nr:hypothetical protein [Spirochaetia bacterium]
MRLRTKLLVVMLGLCLVISLAFAVSLWRHGSEFFSNQLASDQMQMGQLIARNINANLHKDLTTSAIQQPDSYRKLVNSLRNTLHNSDEIAALYTLNYDAARGLLVYGIDTREMTRDTIQLQTDGHGFFIGLDREGDLVFEHNGRETRRELNVTLAGKPYRIEKRSDGNLYLNAKRIFTFLHSDPLEVSTQDGILNSENFFRTVDGVSLTFMAKGAPKNPPGAIFLDDAKHLAQIKNALRYNHDEIEKASSKRPTRILSIIPGEEGRPAGVLVIESNTVELRNLQRAMLVSACIIIGSAIVLSLLIAWILGHHIQQLKSVEPIFGILAPSSKLLTFSDSHELATNVDTSHPVLFCSLESDKDPATVRKYLDEFEKYLTVSGSLIIQRAEQNLMVLFPAGMKGALAVAIELHKKVNRTNKTLKAKGKSQIRIASGMHTGKATLGTTPDQKTTIVAPALDLARDLALLASKMNLSLLTTEPLRKRLENRKQQDMRFIGTVRSRTTGKRMRIYDVYGSESSEVCKLRNATRTDVETGISLFYEKRIDEALQRFTQALATDESDPVAQRYNSQIQRSLGIGPQQIQESQPA